MQYFSSSPDNNKHDAKVSLEDKGGKVVDKLVKNPTDPGGWLQGYLPLVANTHLKALQMCRP